MMRKESLVTHFSIALLTPALLASVAASQVTSGPILRIDEDIHEEYLGSATEAQNVQPFAAQRGVGLDGSLRSQAPFGWRVNANPYAHEWNDNARYNDLIMLDTGRYSPTEIDLSLPAPGFSWTVGRTYTIPEGGDAFEGYMGYNWQQFSQPEVVYHAIGGNDNVIYLVYGADRFLEFRELEDGSDVFRGVNGASGAIVLETITGTDSSEQSVDHDMFVYWDRGGTRSYFFDGDDTDNNPSGHKAGGQLWKIVDAAGNTAYVGDETNPTAAITSGYDAGARMQVAYDTAGRKYDYTYSVVNSKTVLTSVEAFVDPGSGWESTGAKVDYTYATTFSADRFDVGDLKVVEVSSPLSGFHPSSNPSDVVTYETRYRYYTEGTDAHWFYLKHSAEAMRRFYTIFPTGDIYTYTNGLQGALKPYSEVLISSYLTGDDTSPNYPRIKILHWPGQNDDPDAQAAGRADFSYGTYTTFDDDEDEYNSQHARYTNVRTPSSSYEFSQYFDESGQPLSRVVNPGAEGGLAAMWTFVSRDATVSSGGADDLPVISDAVEGMINAIATPMAVSTGNTNPAANGTGYISPCVIKANTSGQTDGYMVKVFPREVNTSDPYHGFMLSRSWQNGRSPASTLDADGPHKVRAFEYLDDVNTVTLAGEYEMHAPLVSRMTRYTELDFGSGQGLGEITDYAYKFHAEPLSGTSTAAADDPQWLAPREITTGLPAVPTSMLGSGVSETETEFFRADGTKVYFRDANDVYFYHEHENNLRVRMIRDADLSQTSDYASADAPSNYWATVPTTTGAMHLITDWDRDEIGRIDEQTLATGRVKTYYHTALATGEPVTVGSAKTSGSTHTGPGSYVAYDHAGNMIVDAEISLEPGHQTTPGQTTTSLSSWIDTAATNPLDSLQSVASFARVRHTICDETGKVPYAIRTYHTLPSSGLGERYYNYDEEMFGYGALWRIEYQIEAHGTRRDYRYDNLGEIDLIEVGSYDPRWEPDYLGSTTSVVLPSYKPVKSAYNTADSGFKQTECCVIVVSFFGKPFTKRCFEGSDDPRTQTFGTGDQGVSFHQIDIQERSIFDYNPIAPHKFRQFDNLGRLVASGSYKAIPTGWLLSTLPSADDRHDPDIFDLANFDSREHGPTNTPDQRTELVEYVYNPRGQIYKEIRYNIDQSTGSIETYPGTSDQVKTETIYGYDAVGRLIYTSNGSVSKTTYDAIGRVTDSYTVGYSDDVLTNYSDLFDVEDDVVLRETHFAINNESGNIALRVDVDREPDIPLQPQILGKLDETDYSDHTSISISAANMRGRPQITEYQFDVLDRPLERINHGTGNIDTATFNLSSPPSGALETSVAYGADGRILSMTDPLGRVQLREYDTSDQLIERIDNYVQSGTADDENRKTAYEYENRRLTKYRAFKADGTSQDTTYRWQVEDSGGYLVTSESADNLIQTTYPDSKTENYEWDIYGNLEYFTDRAGNEFKIIYDDNYRPEVIDYVKIANGFESEPNDEIQIYYEDRGLISSIGQYSGGTLQDLVSFSYDGWGALESYTQSHDWLKTQASDAVDKSVTYEWSSSQTTGPSALRLVSQTNPDSSVLSMLYSGSTNSAISRVLSMTLDRDGSGTTHSPVTVASYRYLGLDRVSRTEYPENDVYSDLQNGSNVYDALDRFNRVTRSRWNRERASNEVPFFDTTVHWDDGSNVVGTTDHIFDSQFNFVYTNDDLDRITQSQRGDGSGTSITTTEEQEDWVLSKIGNWSNHDLDLNGDLDYIDTDEFQAESTFSSINEQTQIDLDLDDDGQYDDDTITRTYDDAGNLTVDPDKGYHYRWDSLGRMVAIWDGPNDSNDNMIAEFKYNALGYRIAERLDSTGDGFVTSADDVWKRLVYDARWRVIETYEVDISVNTEDQAERHVHHAAGLYGVGTGSYIDSVVLRDRDTDADGILDDERHYFCKNWRHDVAAIVNDQGYQLEQARYSPYGVPFAIPFVDQDQDGDVDTNDGNLLSARFGGAYDVRADADLDGDVDFNDISFYSSQGSAIDTSNIGRGVQSSYSHNRGYAGYWRIDELRLSNVRYRWYDARLGTWISKDPLGYIDGASLFGYLGNKPVIFLDPMGLGPIRWLADKIEGAAGAVADAASDAANWAIDGLLGDNEDTETGSGLGDDLKRAKEYNRRLFEDDPELLEALNSNYEMIETAGREGGAAARGLMCEYALAGLAAKRRRSPDADDGGNGVPKNGTSDGPRYPRDPDDWTPPPGVTENPKARDATNGRHRQWVDEDGNIVRRWDASGREAGKERGPHWHDYSDDTGGRRHIDPDD